MVVVDTRSRGRIKEYLDRRRTRCRPSRCGTTTRRTRRTSRERSCARRRSAPTPLSSRSEAMRRGCTLRPEDATIALTGIFADTGNFTHENVTSADFEAAGWLIAQGASLPAGEVLPADTQGGVADHALPRAAQSGSPTRRCTATSCSRCTRKWTARSAGSPRWWRRSSRSKAPTHSSPSLLSHGTTRRSSSRAARSPGWTCRGMLRAFGGGGHAQASSALLKGHPGREDLPRSAGLPEDDARRCRERDRDHGDARANPSASTGRSLDAVAIPGGFRPQRDAGHRPRREALRLPEPAGHHEGAARRPDGGTGELPHGPARSCPAPRHRHCGRSRTSSSRTRSTTFPSWRTGGSWGSSRVTHTCGRARDWRPRSVPAAAAYLTSSK